MKILTKVFLLLSFFVTIVMNGIGRCEYIEGTAAYGSSGSTKSTFEVLLTGSTSGKAITALTKANFKFITCRDLNGVPRSITWTVAELAVPGAYRFTISPSGWSYYNYSTGSGDVTGIIVLFKAITTDGNSSGPVEVGFTASF